MEHLKNQDRLIQHILSAPFIYVVFFWFVFLDLLLEVYHQICFPLYWIELVNRKNYFQYDRFKLKYLNPLQKINCLYCSYWNWLLAYASEIAWRTEKYWCWIRHSWKTNFIEPKHHNDFLPYWDEKAFYNEYIEENKVKIN